MEVPFLYVSNELSLLTMPLSLGNTPAALQKGVLSCKGKIGRMLAGQSEEAEL